MAKKSRPDFTSDLAELEKIKKLAIVAVFSDDELMERLVLKGGNALDLIHGISTRASIDIDLSMKDAFSDEEREQVEERIGLLIRQTFRENNYEVIDLSMNDRPPEVTAELAEFWGGYSIEFKLVPKKLFEEFAGDVEQLRRRAVQIGQGTRFIIEISKFEFTAGKQTVDLYGYQVYVYSPAMLAAEKLRAICQQMPEYNEIVKRKRSGAARARDFLDIHMIVNRCNVDMTISEHQEIIRNMFDAKRVPLTLLPQIRDHREFHRSDFQAVRDSVNPGVSLEEFDFYFDYVLEIVRRLEPLWHV